MKIEGVCKSYGKHIVFDNFDLEIREGEILCVLGNSGGGKTTLLNILAELTPYTGEKIGVPDRVSYIFQEPRLLSNLTARGNLAFVGCEKEKIDETLRKVELLDKADKRPDELSGGERQRVSIARAFCADFELLLMDEPFSSLDTGLKVRLIKMFDGLWQEKKRTGEKATAVFVTHDLEEALMLADRIVVLKNGKIVFERAVKRVNSLSEYGAPSPLRKEILEILL